MLEEIKSILESRLTEMEKSITKSVEEKIKSAKLETESYASKAAEISEKTSKPGVLDFREIMMNTRNEELAEERDKRLRSKNIIIHGRAESGRIEEDKRFVTELMKKLQLEHICVKLVRQGSNNEDHISGHQQFFCEKNLNASIFSGHRHVIYR